ncbi:MFS transporter [Deinococcus sonorensis]
MTLTRTLQNALPWPQPNRGLMLRAVLLLGLCELVRTGLYVGFLPQQLAAHGLPLSAAGLAWTVHYASDTLCRSPGGHLVERYGLRRVLLIGCAVSLLCVLLMQLVPYAWLLVPLAALHGAALSPLWPAVMTLSSVRADSDQQPKAVAVVSAAAGPFTGLGFLGIGTLSSLHFASGADSRLHTLGGWPLAILLLAQTLALLLTLGLSAVRLHTGEPARAAPPAQLRRTLLFLMPAALIQTLALSVLALVIRNFADDIHLGQWGLNGVMAAGALSAYLLLGYTSRLAGRYGAQPLLVAGLLLAALGMGLMATLPPLWGYVLLAVLLGTGYACLLPGWGGLVASLLPQENRAASWGMVMTVENAGMATGPLLGTVAAGVSLRAPFLLSMVLLLLTAAVYLWPSRRSGT